MDDVIMMNVVVSLTNDEEIILNEIKVYMLLMMEVKIHKQILIVQNMVYIHLYQILM